MMERTTTIRASLREVERTLLIAVVLVILVVFAVPAQRRARPSSPPSRCRSRSSAPSASMYLLGYSLNNLSLMALTIATGFVVDDAIVVLENVSRHIERGMAPVRGGAEGRARGGLHRGLDERLAGGGVHPDPLHGRDHRAALPRVRRDALGGDRHLAGGLAHHHADDVLAPAAQARTRRSAPGASRAGRSAASTGMLRGYERSARLGAALPARWCCWSSSPPSALNVYLYTIVPKGFFPQQDTGRLIGLHPRRPVDLVPGDARQARRIHRHRDGRSGGGERDRLHRRRRLGARNSARDVRRAEAAQGARADRPGDGAPARGDRRRSPAPTCSSIPIQDLRGGGAPGARRGAVHAARRRPGRAAHLGAEARVRAARRARAHRRELRPGEPRPADVAA